MVAGFSIGREHHRYGAAGAGAAGSQQRAAEAGGIAVKIASDSRRRELEDAAARGMDGSEEWLSRREWQQRACYWIVIRVGVGRIRRKDIYHAALPILLKHLGPMGRVNYEEYMAT